MATPEAMDKLRAVLDYTPEEAARRLPGDPQELYDALTRRLQRTVAVKSVVRRKVIVQSPDLGEGEEPSGFPIWVPPPPEPEPLPAPLPPEPAPEASSPWPPVPLDEGPAVAEASSVLEASEPEAEPAPRESPARARAEDEDQEFFSIVRSGDGPVDLRPVEPEMTLSEREWSNLEQSPDLPEETAEAPAPAGQDAYGPPAEEEEAFEEVELAPGTELDPADQAAFAPPSRAAAPAEVAPPERALAEFEVEEEAEVSTPADFEVLEEGETEVGEGEEPPFQINDYTLFRREGAGRSGKAKHAYFFSTEWNLADAVPASLPEGYEVILNEDTGVPVIRKSQARVLPVVDIEGLGPVMAQRLERAGVRTTRDLQRMDVRAVSEATGISERLLGNFRAMSDLLRVPGIEPAHAAGLVYAGVRSVEALLEEAPAELAKRVGTAAKDHQLRLKGKVNASKVKSWQDKARKMEG